MALKTPYSVDTLLRDIEKLVVARPDNDGIKSLIAKLHEAYESGCEADIKLHAMSVEQVLVGFPVKLDMHGKTLLGKLAKHGTSHPEQTSGKSPTPVPGQLGRGKHVTGVDVKADGQSQLGKNPSKPFGETFNVGKPIASAAGPSNSNTLKGGKDLAGVHQPAGTTHGHGKPDSSQKEPAGSKQLSQSVTSTTGSTHGAATGSSHNTTRGPFYGGKPEPSSSATPGIANTQHGKGLVNADVKGDHAKTVHDTPTNPALLRHALPERDTHDTNKGRAPSPQIADDNVKQIRSQQAEIDDVEKRLQDALKDATDFKESAEKNERKINELLDDKKRLEGDKKMNMETIGKVEHEKEELSVLSNAKDDRIQNLIREVERCKRRQKETEDAMESQRRRYEEANKGLKEECDDLKTRFSRLAGDKLHKNNPDIADLSDGDRAVKLSERFSTLYDDEWTDAFQTQTEKLKHSPEEAIKFLLDSLLSSYDFCSDTAKRQMTSISSLLMHPRAILDDLGAMSGGNTSPRASSRDRLKPSDDTGKGRSKSPKANKKSSKDKGKDVKEPTGKSTKDNGASPDSQTKIPEDIEKLLKESRRKWRDESSANIQQAFIEKMRSEYQDLGKLQDHISYWSKCADLCWRMVLQDPPLRLDAEAKPGSKINHAVYKCYSATGDVMDFLVWPALLITGGGLVSKGVVQPKINKSDKR